MQRNAGLGHNQPWGTGAQRQDGAFAKKQPQPLGGIAETDAGGTIRGAGRGPVALF